MKDLEKLTNDKGVITALAIDQRGALKRMLGERTTYEAISEFKTLVSEELTPFASSILLDPEYGLNAAYNRDENCGLILAYEQTGYDKQEPGRRPDLIPNCSVKNLKEQGADGIKLLIYVDVDEVDGINQEKEAFVERVGSECNAEDIPFFLEILTYDDNIGDEKSKEFAKVKPHKVIDAMKRYSEDRFNVDVLKVEVPVNMNFVEGYTENEYLHSEEEASEYFKAQSEATDLPFIFLSAGVTPYLFQETLKFANESGSTFNGVLCGRATWSGATNVYSDDSKKAKKWLTETGVSNINNLNDLVNLVATPIK
ncbi:MULTISPECIES: tagatose-bisphosphate aldolase [Mammaliicoccus]|uniref:Tagatose 1,6-diphosphate aldolase n=1 Tax=Mammaliicoccus lentus TaxID=42858 RepID=A0ABS6GVN1_MAMLE|nr:tagatose-bisphosphate aldolase [Mammaliicoccus lentus]MBF0840708.1 tagatose-bisphosphate aldolase [Mammaliicoccus lentus]MBU6113507.1 tagatose-bisphosphate aldolase [Mammaliicoccus lentus]WQL56037.1 tagatose-bisphosphate aldolase [Mammaliicoccus lentus]